MTPDQWMEAFRINIESLHSNLAQSIEAAAADREAIRRDGENIRQLAKIAQAQSESLDKLVRIAERHQGRLDAIDGGVSA